MQQRTVQLIASVGSIVARSCSSIRSSAYWTCRRELIRWLDVRTSTYVQGMPNELQSAPLGSYRRLQAGRTMQRAVCPSMIDRDVETRIACWIRVRGFPIRGQSHDL